MSSSSEGEVFKIGAQVDCTDGQCGHLARVIFEPVADALTHLIVEHGHDEMHARMVSVDHFARVENDVIKLSCTKQRFEQFDEAEDAQFLLAADGPRIAGGLGLPIGHHREAMLTDRVPVGEVEIRRGDPVHATDGWIGSVQGLVVDPADHHVTHLLLQEGHVWGRKQVAIPIGAAKRRTGEVRVELTKEQIEALPPVTLKSN